jgi:hypothetical protein
LPITVPCGSAQLTGLVGAAKNHAVACVKPCVVTWPLEQMSVCELQSSILPSAKSGSKHNAASNVDLENFIKLLPLFIFQLIVI